jgi:hypothetical protein
MADLSMGDSVTGDYLRVALDHDSGKLKHDNVIAEALRGALLIDLARLGRLTHDDAGTQVDTTPTGMAQADELLHDVDTHPKRSMEVWLQRGEVHLHEFIAELLADGLWTVKRHGINANHARYVDRDAAHYQELHAVLVSVIAGEVAPADHRQAALAALAEVTGLAGPGAGLQQSGGGLLKHCGDLAWIVADVTRFLLDAQGDDLAAGTVAAITTGAQIAAV